MMPPRESPVLSPIAIGNLVLYDCNRMDATIAMANKTLDEINAASKVLRICSPNSWNLTDLI